PGLRKPTAPADRFPELAVSTFHLFFTLPCNPTLYCAGTRLNVHTSMFPMAADHNGPILANDYDLSLEFTLPVHSDRNRAAQRNIEGQHISRFELQEVGCADGASLQAGVQGHRQPIDDSLHHPLLLFIHRFAADRPLLFE